METNRCPPFFLRWSQQLGLSAPSFAFFWSWSLPAPETESKRITRRLLCASQCAFPSVCTPDLSWCTYTGDSLCREHGALILPKTQLLDLQGHFCFFSFPCSFSFAPLSRPSLLHFLRPVSPAHCVSRLMPTVLLVSPVFHVFLRLPSLVREVRSLNKLGLNRR